jgi:uncharacterized lipoprotein YddW (UPF0748 family)
MLAAGLLLGGCGAATSVIPPLEIADAGRTSDAGQSCSPPVPCYPTCPSNSHTCARGHLDIDACLCRDDEGDVVPWPDDTIPIADAKLESIAVDPVPPAVIALQKEVGLKVIATFSDGSKRDVTSVAGFEVNPTAALESLGEGRFRALATGEVSVVVSFSEGTARRETRITFKVQEAEARAVWVTRFSYANADDVRRIINTAADARFNIILFQVRGTGDAFYRSTLEPWAAQLGALGKDPGWDPLQIAIDTAHARGIELHAYINVFTAWSGTAAIPDTTPPHVLKAHPDWVEQDSTGTTLVENMKWLAPGIAAVRDHNVAVVKEVLTKYDVDGIHLDRIRYSGPGMGYNALESQAFQAQYGGASDKRTTFRIESVNAQVRAIHDAIAEVKPQAKLSAAVWGIHTRLPNCSTSEGISDYYQDSWAWAEGGYIEALAPMIYWANGTGCTDYGALLATFQAHRGDRQIWAGMHVNQCASANCTFDWNGLQQRITTARNQQAAGVTFFASATLDTANAWSLLSAGPFAEAALVP